MLNNFIIEISLVIAISMVTNLIIIIFFARGMFRISKRNDINAVQASHQIPAARLGGISIFVALIGAAMPFIGSSNTWPNYPLLLLSSFPVFVIGLCEDLGYFVSPRLRLLAALLSGVVFVSLFSVWLPRTDIPVLDSAIQWAPFGIVFSLFIATGISHSFNLIDGLNGLAGFTAVGAALSLSMIAHQEGLVEIRDVLIVLSGAILGFLIFNFPFGKIFLGDAGAYVTGHMLFWVAILILYASPAVTPFAMLLIFFWPVADTLLAIARRVYFGAKISEPDRLHFHQLVMRGVEIVVLGRKRRRIANPLATMLMLPLILFPMVAGVLLSLERGKAMLACLLYFIFFLSAYKVCIILVRHFRRSV